MEYEVQLTPPEGPQIQKIYREFTDNFLFPEDLILGPYNSAKSTALVDAALFSMLDYPGSLVFFLGNTLAKLKRTTVDKLAKRGRLIFESANEREAVYKTPVDIDPWTKQPTQSILRAMGLDTTDVESEMSSSEPFRSFIEEASDVSSEAHDTMIARTRGKAYHKTQKNHHLLILKSRIWGAIYNEELDPDLVLEVMGIERSELHHPMQGPNAVKCADNPRDSHLWTRYVGVPYPQDIITEEFVKAHVGVKNVYKTRADLLRMQMDFDPGDTVVLGNGQRHVVKSLTKYDDDEETPDTLTMLDGSEHEADKVLIWAQRRTQYVFPWMNESRNKAAGKNMIFVSNSDLAERMMAGKEDRKQGKVFTNFINAPVREGGHILPPIARDRLDDRLLAFFGVDQGGGHATAVAGSFRSRRNEELAFTFLVIFFSYLAYGETSSETAINIKTVPTPRMNPVWAADPAMWNRNYAGDRDEYGTIPTYADRFIEAGVPLVQASSGDLPYEDVNELFLFKDNYLGKRKVAGLYITEDMTDVIYTLDTLTWAMVRNKRSDWRVDMGDAIKFMVSGSLKYPEGNDTHSVDIAIRAGARARLPWEARR